ncbi:MAG: trypsin-like peptidase domain-containing protein [Candidatus Paceibacterota bacterium]
MFNNSSLIKTVRKVMPSVVSIIVKKDKEEINGGSGFIIKPNGTIITNIHVISEKENNYTVIIKEEEIEAEILARDPLNDIAILKVNTKEKLPYLNINKKMNVQLGQDVLAFGNVFGMFQNTVSHGIISGLSRSIKAQIESNKPATEIRGLIQTDAAINPGNSGGPLTDNKGNVIGINFAVVAGAQNIGFAIPIKVVEKDLEELEEFGRIRTPFLGVRYITLDKKINNKFKKEINYGALVLKEHNFEKAVISNSPADKTGIKEGDILLKWNGEEINQNKKIQDYLSESEPGDEVELEILRNKESILKKVILSERE